MSNEFKELKSEGERWDSKVIPERWMEEFREMSPGTTCTCAYVFASYMYSTCTLNLQIFVLKKLHVTSKAFLKIF